MDNLLYHLAENQLTPDPTDCMAVVETTQSVTDTDLVKEMLKRGTLSTETDIVAIMNLMYKVIGDLVAQGKPLNLSLFNGSPSISGVFTGPDDAFDPARHYVRYNLNPGVVIRDAVKNIKTVKTESPDLLPIISKFTDMVSQTANDVLTPGGIAELIGSRLAFDAAEPEQGIWFVTADGNETKVVTLALNKPSKLIFMVPALVAGEYEVVLRVKFVNSKLLKKVSFRKKLTVPGAQP